MTYQLNGFLFDFALIMAICLSLAVAAILTGMRIGTQRLAIPVLTKTHALSQLTDDNLKHMKMRYLAQQYTWQRATVLAGALACLAGAVYLAYQHYSVAPNGLISFFLAFIMVLFLASTGSAGYHSGARMGMVQSFKRASQRQLIALHKRLLKPALLLHVEQIVKQLPKKKHFIHLMVVHYAIHEALKGMKRENA